ncbi:hypothetical protein POVWA2_005740 [Plasmodium ovale wallikeri]|uniref:Mitochondrial carrier protein n=2 Tax=Plasmodium ovale TaxID=36330 RepID=A0A1A8YIK4_PLAOA|nr:hypothetical protein POVWA1_005640 [Plasmodium ovale wallikeri]SBT31739.1 hypothetical protein POVWA2_005740 [Plasmodium ovale wallikeri]SBT75460.1 conserved Plasmodium protein, unknown function [Plasmodium ovale]
MNLFNFFLLSILFIKIRHVLCVSTNEVLRDKRIEFNDYAKVIIHDSNLVDKNEKLLGNSLRTYKYYLVKSTTEIRAIFIYDDFNINIAKILGIHNEQHEAYISNIQSNINSLYPLDETSTFSEVLYKERKMFSLETDYSTTNYVFTKFIFNINIEEEEEEYIMSLLINNELNMKKKNLEIVTKDNTQKEINRNKQYEGSNSVSLYKKSNHPPAFAQFIGALMNVVSIITSISGAISAVSSMFTGSPSPSPPSFLGDEYSVLSTYEERKVASTPSNVKKNATQPSYDDEYADEDAYEDDYDEYGDEYGDEYDDEYGDEYDDEYDDEYGDDHY